jgi:hypothetical protein
MATWGLRLTAEKYSFQVLSDVAWSEIINLPHNNLKARQANKSDNDRKFRKH